jgi:arsenite transporter
MFKALAHIKKKLTLYLPMVMVVAVIFGYYFDTSSLKVLLPAIIFLMVYPMMVNLKYKELLSRGNTKLHVTTQLINFTIIPIVGFMIARLMFYDNVYIITGVLIMSLLPTSGMTISWTGFAKGNISAAIKMMVLGLVIGSILTPLYLKLFLGSTINIPLKSILTEIVKVVFVPMLFGYITQTYLIKKHGIEAYQKKYKGKFPLLSTLGLLGIVFLSTSLKAKTIVSDPSLLVKIFVALVIYYSINFLITTFVAKRFFNRGDGVALVYGIVMRNLSIALALALSIFAKEGSDVALVLAVAFVVQIQGAALYLKSVDKIFKTSEV